MKRKDHPPKEEEEAESPKKAKTAEETHETVLLVGKRNQSSSKLRFFRRGGGGEPEVHPVPLHSCIAIAAGDGHVMYVAGAHLADASCHSIAAVDLDSGGAVRWIGDFRPRGSMPPPRVYEMHYHPGGGGEEGEGHLLVLTTAGVLYCQAVGASGCGEPVPVDCVPRSSALEYVGMDSFPGGPRALVAFDDFFYVLDVWNGCALVSRWLNPSTGLLNARVSNGLVVAMKACNPPAYVTLDPHDGAVLARQQEPSGWHVDIVPAMWYPRAEWAALGHYQHQMEELERVAPRDHQYVMRLAVFRPRRGPWVSLNLHDADAARGVSSAIARRRRCVRACTWVMMRLRSEMPGLDRGCMQSVLEHVVNASSPSLLFQ